jgi:hypothetical protein
MFLGRTKKNLHKYNEAFYLYLKENLTISQISELNTSDALSIMMSASDPEIKRFALKRFFFGFGIRKIIQIRNKIFATSEVYNWKIKEEFLEEGSEVEWLKQRAQIEIAPFDNENLDWMGPTDSYIDLTKTDDTQQYEDLETFDFPSLDENESKPEIHQDSDVKFLEMVNKEIINKEEDFVFGRIGDLPEEYFPFLRQELINNYSKESYQVLFPEYHLSNVEINEALSRNELGKKELQTLFELFKITNKFITTNDQKKVFWTLFLSPEISSLQLEKQFGLFNVSHLKITESSKKPKAISDSSVERNDN